MASPPRARAFDTIVLGGLTAGALDILDAFAMRARHPRARRGATNRFDRQPIRAALTTEDSLRSLDSLGFASLVRARPVGLAF
jgi:hypothetical protein